MAELTDISKQVGNLGFITENPAATEYRADQNFDLNQRKGEADLTKTNLDNQYTTAAMPSKLRSVNAGATSDEAAANVAQQTAPYKISDAKVAADYAAPNAAVGLRQAQATATNTQMQPFYKSLDYGIAGNVDEAKAVAGAAGQQIPDAVWQDREYLAAIKNGAKYAEEAYPNQPAAQSRYMTNTFIPYVQGQRQAGAKVDDPSLPYRAAGKPGPSGALDVPETPQAAPEPPENTIPANARESVFQQRLTVGRSLYPNDPKAAADYASGTRTVTDADAKRFGFSQAETELHNNPDIRDSFRTPADMTAWKEKRATEIANQIRPPTPPLPVAPTLAPVAPSSTPAPVPAPRAATAPPRPASVPAGSAYSPSRGLWRDPQGNLFGPDGTPAR